MNVNGNSNNAFENIINSKIYIIDGKQVSIPRYLGSPVLILKDNEFFGRENELKEIHKLLFQGENLLLLVNGEGGIGKTTLAAKYYQQYDAEYQHLAWVFAERNLTDALLILAGNLGIEFPPEMESKERLALQLQKMRNLPKPCLLVIDNANELAALETHYQALRSCPNFHILLTSRISEFEKITPLKIEGLPPAQALALFKSHYPKHSATEDALFYAIHTAVGANTLLLELIAKNLRANNQLKTHYALADLAADIQQGLLNMRHSKAVLTDWYKGGKASVKDIFFTLYDLSGLSVEERALLSVFAVLPAEAIPFEVIESLLIPAKEESDKTFEMLIQLSETNETLLLQILAEANISKAQFEEDKKEFLNRNQFANVADTLLSLAQKGWLDYTEATTTFKISPVIQEISKSKNAASLLTDTDSLIDSLIDKLDYEEGTGHFVNVNYTEAAVFTRYAMGVVNNFLIANYNIGVLCERIGRYYLTTGNLPQAFFYYEKGIEIYKELCLTHPENADYKNGLAISYEKLGSTHTSLGNLEKALAFYEERSRLGKELYEAYPKNVEFKNGLAISYSKLGNTHKSLGNLEKALAFYEAEIDLFKELYEAYPANVSFKNGLAVSYSKLGETHTSLDNLEKALAFYEEQTDLFKELHEAYPTNVSFKNGLAISYEKLGQTHTSLGNLEKALAFYEAETDLFKELYEAYPANVIFKNGLAISYAKLGVFCSGNLTDKDKAKVYFRQAESLWQELVIAAPLYVEFQKYLRMIQKDLKSL